MTNEFILLISAAYLVGSVPTAYIAAKLSKRIDIRQYGSGNVGASNLLKFTSKRTALPVIIFDIVKGMLLIWTAQAIGLGIAQQATVGIATIVGHIWPVFLRFSGGRGILTALGVVIILPLSNSLVPWETIVALTIVCVAAFAFHNLPLGVIAALVSLPLVSWAAGHPLPLTLGYTAIFLLVLIKRLVPQRHMFADSTDKKQVLVNRLLFDRDLRDREAWIQRAPHETTKQPPKHQQRRGKG